MKLKNLKDRIRSAGILKDVRYALLSLEEYVYTNELDLDLWWFTKEVEDLAQFQEQKKELDILLDTAKVATLEELLPLVLDGVKYREKRKDKLEELSQIRQDLIETYSKLTTLLSRLT